MASYHDLLDAIARVRSVTGDPDAWKAGLTGDDVAAALNPASPPGALGAVMTKLAAAHPDVFLSGPPTGPSGPPPRVGEGAAAEAIRDAEGALSHQDTDAAHVDLQVVTAVLNAHAAHADGLTELTALQRDIEATVRTRTDLDTPAGAREFQRYLIGKLRDIRNVVEHSSLDATSQASLAAALSALYAASTPSPQDRGPAAPPAGQSGTVASESEPRRPPTPQTTSAPVDSASPPQPVYPDPDVLTPMDPVDPMPNWMAWSDPPLSAPPPASVPAAPSPAPAAAPAPPMPLPAVAAPSWGGASPGGAPFGPALPGISAGMGSGQSRPLLPDPPTVDLPRPADSDPADIVSDPESEPDVPAESAGDDTAGASPPADDPAVVDLPDGDTVTASSPELAAAITAAVGGTPIPDAFRQQGISIPAPGSAVLAPLDPARLSPGDIGMLTDRHAVALGNGKALLDERIQPLGSVMGPNFLGWQHPPEPHSTAAPGVPAPNRAAATAPS